jgi:V8-like Glu-specific endopeptidase
MRIAALCCLIAALLAAPTGAAASVRLHPQTTADAGSGLSRDSACAAGVRRTKRGKDAGRPNSRAIRPTEDAAPRSVRRRQTCARGHEAGLDRVARFWTPARMRSARPLDAGRGAALTASASFAQVVEPEVPPYSVNGRLFVRQGNKQGFCSATAIDSPSRRLVLTAGHCVNTGPGTPGGHSVWSSFLEFVPAYSGGTAPFGAFVAHRGSVFALKQWARFGNPNFDVGAVLVEPNAEGVNVADAVGGGAKIVTDLSRHEEFQTFGYPGETRWMQGCDSPYVGDDSLTYRVPGPPTIAIRCHWVPGASGGGWLIDEGGEIDGLTSYGKRGDRRHTFGPYFSSRNVGRLVAGL